MRRNGVMRFKVSLALNSQDPMGRNRPQFAVDLFVSADTTPGSYRLATSADEITTDGGAYHSCEIEGAESGVAVESENATRFCEAVVARIREVMAEGHYLPEPG
jgi:hypothetical protein